MYTGLLLAGMLFSPGADSVSLFRPANGFLISVSPGLRSGLRQPLMVLCAGAVFAVNTLHGKSWAPSLGFALAHVLEAALAVWLIGRVEGGYGFLGNLKGTLRFFLWVIPASAAAAAGLGAAVAAWAFGGPYARHFMTWFPGDAAGIAVVVPAILAWKQPSGWKPRRFLVPEFAACLASTLCTGFLIFARPAGLWEAAGHPQAYLTLPFLVWAALRFGVRGASMVLLSLYAVSAWFTSRGHGPFIGGIPGAAADPIPLRLFPFAASFCALVPAVLLDIRKRAQAQPLAAHAGSVDWSRLEELSDGTPQGAELVKKLVRLFIDTTQTALEEIRVDIASGRLGVAAKSLHKLKGGSGAVGAVAVSAEVVAMESAVETLREEKRKPGMTDEEAAAALRAGQKRLETVFAETCREFESRG
jgi:integral membrane sensor domain MASE1/HPt (histidine-containing phosphotransfer) domain-containing protein